MPSFGFGTITSQGVGSNINIPGIVSQLVEIERIPLDRLIAQKASFDAKISALGTIKSSLSSFQSALSNLTSASSLQPSKAVSSNSAIVGASGTNDAVAGNYSVKVTQLAQSQKLVAAGQADSTAAIGAGTTTTLTIDLGTISGGTFDSGTGKYTGSGFAPGANPSFDVVIDNTNNTLEGIRDAINTANQGVTATIVNDGNATNPYRLVLSSDNSGVDESMRIAVAGDATLSALLSQDVSGVQNLSQTVTAQDANFSVDGISITKSSNTVTDVIQGVTLTLADVTSGTPVTVTVSQDTDATKASVEAFVDAYNDLRKLINAQTDSGSGGSEAGVFASDSGTRQIYNVMRDALNQEPTGITGLYTNFSSIGIAFQADGSLALDSTMLAAAIQDDSSNVAELFSSTDGYATRLNSTVTDMLAYNGTIDARTEAFKDRISLLDDRQISMEGQLERTEARLRARFTNLDVLMSTMSLTSSYLTQQLDALNAQTG